MNPAAAPAGGARVGVRLAVGAPRRGLGSATERGASPRPAVRRRHRGAASVAAPGPGAVTVAFQVPQSAGSPPVGGPRLDSGPAGSPGPAADHGRSGALFSHRFRPTLRLCKFDPGRLRLGVWHWHGTAI
jgi:hypothetical protein